MPKQPREPEPPRKTTWAIYKFGARREWLGVVEAASADEAIEKAAIEYDVCTENT